MRGQAPSTSQPSSQPSSGFGHPLLNFVCYGYLVFAVVYPLHVTLPSLLGGAAAAAGDARIGGMDPASRSLLAFSPLGGMVSAIDRRVPEERDRAAYRHLLAAWWLGALLATTAGLVPLARPSIRAEVQRSLPTGGLRVLETLATSVFVVLCFAAYRAGDLWFTPGSRSVGLLDSAGMGLPMVLSSWAVVRLASLASATFAPASAGPSRGPQRRLDFSRSPRVAARGDFACAACGVSIDAAPFWNGIEVRCPGCGEQTVLRFSGTDRRHEVTYEEFRTLLGFREVRDAVSPVLVLRLRCAVEDDGTTLHLKAADGTPIPLREAHRALQADESVRRWLHSLVVQRQPEATR